MSPEWQLDTSGWQDRVSFLYVHLLQGGEGRSNVVSMGSDEDVGWQESSDWPGLLEVRSESGVTFLEPVDGCLHVVWNETERFPGVRLCRVRERE